jgi:hypothetical protein
MMATASEQRHAEMVDDHEKRLKRIERMLADKFEAEDVEKAISEQHPQTMPGGGKKK